jgi:hypothetical protein
MHPLKSTCAAGVGFILRPLKSTCGTRAGLNATVKVNLCH